MAREIVSYTWCDPCLTDDMKETGEDFPIAIGNQKARVIALCERHQKEYLAPLLELLADAPTIEQASPVAAKRAAAGEGGMVLDKKGNLIPAEDAHFCLECPERDRYAMNSRSTLGSHLRRVHDMSIGNYAAKHEGKATASQKCPDCDETLTSTASRINQTMSLHRRAHQTS